MDGDRGRGLGRSGVRRGGGRFDVAGVARANQASWEPFVSSSVREVPNPPDTDLIITRSPGNKLRHVKPGS